MLCLWYITLVLFSLARHLAVRDECERSSVSPRHVLRVVSQACREICLQRQDVRLKSCKRVNPLDGDPVSHLRFCSPIETRALEDTRAGTKKSSQACTGVERAKNARSGGPCVKPRNNGDTLSSKIQYHLECGLINIPACTTCACLCNNKFGIHSFRSVFSRLFFYDFSSVMPFCAALDIDLKPL